MPQVRLVKPDAGLPKRQEPGHRPAQRALFRPRAPSRGRYYKASVAVAMVFVCLAIAFPFWLDFVKRGRDQASFEALANYAASVESNARSLPEGKKPGQIPYEAKAGNPACQAYAVARCNALGIPPGPCGEVAAAALAVPAGAGLNDCRAAIEPKLEEARKLYTEPGETPEVEEESPQPSSQSNAAEGPTQAPKEGEPDVKTQPVAGKQEGVLTPEQRADNLARIYALVEELQRAAQNHATLPAAQAARFEELKRRVEADGSEELRSLYNTLLLQHGRTAGIEIERPSIHAKEGKMVEAQPGEERAKTTTPELEKVRKMLEDANIKAGREASAGTAPQPVVPKSVDPSSVPAPAAISL